MAFIQLEVYSNATDTHYIFVDTKNIFIWSNNAIDAEVYIIGGISDYWKCRESYNEIKAKIRALE